MEFEINVWRSYYDQVNILGLYLKESYPDADGNPAKFKISLEERHKVEKEVAELLRLSDRYLDRCGMFPGEPKWHYNAKDKSTWISSENFAYHHLVSKRKYMRI